MYLTGISPFFFLNCLFIIIECKIINMKLGEKIYILRKVRGLSQEELGLSLSTLDNGVSRQTVSDWENGKSEPKLDNIRALAELLHVSYDVLLDEKLDLHNEDYLKQALEGTYVSSKQVLSNENYYLYRRSFGILPILLFALVLTVGLVLLSYANDKTDLYYAIAMKHNGDKSIMGQAYMNRVQMWNTIGIIARVIPIIGCPIAVGLFIKSIRTVKPVGVMNKKELIVYPKMMFRMNRTFVAPLNEIQNIKKDILGNVTVTLNSNKRYKLFFLKHSKEIVKTFKEYQK